MKCSAAILNGEIDELVGGHESRLPSHASVGRCRVKVLVIFVNVLLARKLLWL
jgi:hypothetical protein